jgi:hypothetical protein
VKEVVGEHHIQHDFGRYGGHNEAQIRPGKGGGKKDKGDDEKSCSEP